MATLRNAPFFPYKVNYKALLAGSLLLGLGLLILGGFYHEQQEIESERAVLRTICALTALPEGAAPAQLFTTLSQYAHDHEEGRRARIARMAGMEPDWTHILQQVSKLSLARRTEVYQAMAKEYGMPDTWSPADIDRRVLLEQRRPDLTAMPRASIMSSD